jgi:hypothetical protein
MVTLLLVVGTLVLAVIGRAMFDPLGDGDRPQLDEAAVAEQQARMMQTMALSVF